MFHVWDIRGSERKQHLFITVLVFFFSMQEVGSIIGKVVYLFSIIIQFSSRIISTCFLNKWLHRALLFSVFVLRRKEKRWRRCARRWVSVFKPTRDEHIIQYSHGRWYERMYGDIYRPKGAFKYCMSAPQYHDGERETTGSTLKRAHVGWPWSFWSFRSAIVLLSELGEDQHFRGQLPRTDRHHHRAHRRHLQGLRHDRLQIRRGARGSLYCFFLILVIWQVVIQSASQSIQISRLSWTTYNKVILLGLKPRTFPPVSSLA